MDGSYGIYIICIVGDGPYDEKRLSPRYDSTLTQEDPQMPTITVNLSDATFAKAQRLAEPLVDTFETLFTKLIEEGFERKRALPNGNGQVAAVKEENHLRLDPDVHENLVHTRVISATVDGREYRPDWNGLMRDLHVLARKRLDSWDIFRQISRANMRQGRFEKDGYKYLPDGDFSIQGVDANLAWKHSLSVAQALKISIKVKLEWRDKDGAAHPGKTAVLEWTPTGS
jgi:hypothetical protein